MTDLTGKGLPCTIEAVSSEAQMTNKDGLSNGSPLSFYWPSAWRRHLVNACTRQCWYCAHA